MFGALGYLSSVGELGSSGSSSSLNFDTRTEAAAATIAPLELLVGTGGFYVAGDGGGALYVKTTGTTLGGFQSADGAWWKLANPEVANVRIFGAVGDGVVDDIVAIQTAIDYAIAQATLKKSVSVYLSPGNYKISFPILMFKWNPGTPGAFSFTSVDLFGSYPGYIGSNKTEIKPTFIDKPAIIIQAGRSSRCYGFSITGTANTLVLPTYADLLEDNVAPWWNTGGARDSRYSPYCGISIDPFGTLPADGGYPDLTQYYVATAPGSTLINIEYAELQGFIIGVAISTSSDTQLGDSITILNCNLSYNKISVCVGQSQNRGIVVRDCHVKGARVVVSSQDYGAANAPLPNIIGGVFVAIKWFISGSAAWGFATISDVYAESIWSLGFWGWNARGFPLSITGCMFKFIFPIDPYGKNVDVNFHTSSLTVFTGCYLGFYSSVERRLNISNSARVVFNSTIIDAEPVFSDLTDGIFENCSNRYSGAGRYSYCAKLTAAFDTQIAANGTHVQGAPGFCIEQGLKNTFIRYRSISDWDTIVLDSVAVAITVVGDGTATYTAAVPARYKVGDYVSTITTWYGEKPVAGFVDVSYARCCIGKVFSIVGSDITLKEVPVSFASGNYAIYLFRLPKIRVRTLGDTTLASLDLTNVSPVTGWTVGDRISGTGIAAGAWITNIAGTTFTISIAATSTNTNVEFFDTKFWVELCTRTAAPTSGVWIRGDYVRNYSGAAKDGNNMVLTGWICTVSGAPGTWEAVYASAVTPAT